MAPPHRGAECHAVPASAIEGVGDNWTLGQPFARGAGVPRHKDMSYLPLKRGNIDG